MHIAAKPLSMNNENRKGGLCNNNIAKSITKRLVKIGVSMRVLRIFLNMNFSNNYTFLSFYKECG